MLQVRINDNVLILECTYKSPIQSEFANGTSIITRNDLLYNPNKYYYVKHIDFGLYSRSLTRCISGEQHLCFVFKSIHLISIKGLMDHFILFYVDF